MGNCCIGFRRAELTQGQPLQAAVQNSWGAENTVITEKFTIVDLDERYMDDVLSICRQELGPDYHSETDFRKCLGNSREDFCKVILDDKDSVYGFSTAMIMGPESADEYLKLPDSRERDEILSSKKSAFSMPRQWTTPRKKGAWAGCSYGHPITGCWMRGPMSSAAWHGKTYTV